MSLKQIKGFQTSDGVLHQNKVVALTHEQKIELRAIFQQHTHSANLTITDAVAVLAVNSEKVMATLHRYRTMINRARGEASKVKVV